MKVVLQVIEGPDQGRVFEYEGFNAFVVGREPGEQGGHEVPSDFYMSRHHFMVVLSGSTCQIRDLDSRNGIWVNGERVTEADLQHGDWIKAGRSKIVFRTVQETVQDAGTQTDATEREDHGQRLADYEILESLPGGGLTQVYRARLKGTPTDVALKVLPMDPTDDERRIEYFLREISISHDLDHPHIVRVVAAGRNEDELWLATEWISGSDLAVLVDQAGPQRASTVMEIGAQILDGLDAAHTRGIIHRDIKPANVLVQKPLRPLHAFVADFGISKSLRSKHSPCLTITGATVGTPHYMAPEQVGNAKRVGVASDVFSVGATLYFLLTDRWHYGDDDGNIWRKVLEGKLVPVSAYRKDVPLALARVIEKALSKEPSRRYRTAKHMRTALLSSGVL